MGKHSASSRSTAPGAEAAILAEAVEKIGTGVHTANARGAFSGEDGGELLADALEREDVRVVWNKNDVTQDKRGAYMKHDPGGAKLKDEFYDCCILSRTNNVRGISARSGFKGRWFIMGITSDKDDDAKYEHGYWLEIRDDGAYRRGDWSEDHGQYENDVFVCKYTMEDIFTIRIIKGDVKTFINEEELGVLGPAGTVSMYGKIWPYHKETLVELMNDYTIAQVTDIDMNSNYLTDKGMIRLCQPLSSDTTFLKKIDLGLNRIGNDSCIRIAETLESKYCRLSWLNLSHNDILCEGAIRLAEALEHEDCHVSVLSLNDNDIKNDGAVRLAEALEKETCLVTSLELAQNRIQDEGLMRLAVALESDICKVTHFKIDGNRSGPNGLQRLAEAMAKTMRLQVGCEDDW